MTALGFDFDVVPADLDEASLSYGRDPAAITRRLARAKALHVAASRPDAIVLAADTIVVHRGDVLGKPVDADDARRMLSRLSGHTHRVITGVAVVRPGARRATVDHVVTRVHLRRLDEGAVEASIARGEPFDKAGAYAIQDPLLRPIESYDGCYCNVVGLPLYTSLCLLREAGITPARASQMPPQCARCPLANS
jgi:septum formation protein